MMLYRIAVNCRTFVRYPPTSMGDFYDESPQLPIESPLNNSVASFRKWIIEDLRISDATITFSREPHPLYDPNNFVHDDQREFLSDDELLQYDEVVYVVIHGEEA